MLNLTRVVKIIGIAVCISSAMPIFAESAPVYDADAIQQNPDDYGTDQAQYLPPPPPPGQEGGGFVPMQQQPMVAAAPSSPPLNMEQRVMRVEQQVNNMQTSDTVPRIESLQDQVQTLRGQVEQLTHQIEQLQAQQKTMYSDLDSRLNQSGNAQPRLIGTPPPPSSAANTAEGLGGQPVLDAKKASKLAAAKPAKLALIERLPAKPTGSQPNVAEEQQIYQTAYNLIKSKKYNDAVGALQNMLKKYPSGQFASNAHYWLGELYGLMGKHDQALTEFNAVVEAYPGSPRVSDAQLKVGLIYASELKWPDAKAALKKVIKHYPGSASARLASEQLKQIKQAGH